MSLLFQPSLFGSGEPVADASFSTIHRVQLDAESWVDVAPGWLCGPDTLFTELAESASWDQRERRMYDHRVAEPRLTCGWGVDEAPPPLGDLAALLSDRYQVHFNSIWANYYRHGGDSVAWHGDRVRFTLQRPRVAILSLGSSRRFGLRPRGGGAGHCGGPRISVTYRHAEPGRGD